ncbi:MAG: TlpA disulfide reductase family protein, partial [Chthonomonadales bacterium]
TSHISATATYIAPEIHWLKQPYLAPPLGVEDKKTPQKLRDVAGKVILMDFWATWCNPCVQAVPQVEAIYQKYKDKGLQVWGLAMEVDGGKNIDRFMADHAMSYVVGMPDNFTRAYAYKCESIPKIVLIDKKGMVRFEAVGYAPAGHEGLEAAIEALLAE